MCYIQQDSSEYTKNKLQKDCFKLQNAVFILHFK